MRVGSADLRTGVTVPYFEQGPSDGVPIVLLHAWGESRHAFSRLMPSLDPSLRAFAFDQRGHRDASKPRTGYSLADYADDVIAFLDAVAVGSAILLGSSSGGYVAQQVAVDHPDRVRGLLLVGAPRSLAGRPPFADEVDALVDPIEPEWVEASLRWFDFAQPIPDEFLADRLEDGVRMPARDALAGLSAAVPPTEMGVIAVPTLIIHGRLDRLLPVEEAERLKAAIPGSRLVIYEDAAHLVLWEHPEHIASDVAKWGREQSR
jgi:pimeloyl-ACP methyl ester carboxylesterase